jgi:leucine dehydrogenase
MTNLADLIHDWDGDAVVSRYDQESSAWMFICIHSRVRGPAAGGTRVRVYPGPADALADAMLLAACMTRKNALADLPWGGGKAVIAVPEIPRGEARAGLYRRFAEMVNSLGGNFVTGPDMNTYAEDLDGIRDACPYLFGSSASVQNGRSVADSTAYGVLCAIRASVAHLDGTDDLHGRSVVVQGAGGVGGSLITQLVAAGAAVKICDVDPDRLAPLTDLAGVEVITPDAALTTPADVFAPCAAGGVLTAETAARLPVRIVAGGANNQLSDLRAAEALRDAGVLYAPDYVANGGGAIHCVCVESLGWSSSAVVARIERLGDTLRDIFDRAERLGVSTAAAAEVLFTERLSTKPNTVAQ